MWNKVRIGVVAFWVLSIVIALIGMVMWPANSLVTQQLDAEYDYVVIGAGSSGAVVAARLSEDPDLSIAILEAGDEETKYPTAQVPLMVDEARSSDADWNYLTVPQKHACGSLNNNQSAWPRGKLLGGSSMLHFLIYIRGSRYDYDRWAANGCDGWGYDDVLPYFRRSEGYRAHHNPYHEKYHGRDGPLIVSDSNALRPLVKTYLKAAVETGYGVADANAENQLGMMPTSFNTDDYGRRVSTASAFLRPAMERSNLHVATLSHVTKILIENKKAVGVEYMRDGRIHRVLARKEIILSAGAIGSPQILMLSGIGPRKHLEEHGIPVVADLPVGENMQDHIFSDGVKYTIEKPYSIFAEKIGLWDLIKFYLFGSGYFQTTGAEGQGFVRSHHQPESALEPYLQLILAATLYFTNATPLTKKKKVPTATLR